MAGTRGKHLLTVYADIPAEIEDDFNNWYNSQHIPERLAISGFHSAVRYESLKGDPKYLALYELEDASVLETPEYAKLRENANDWDKRITPKLQVAARNIYETIFACGDAPNAHTPFLLSVRLDIAPEVEDEFNQWYNEDHLPKLAAVPGVACARRYRSLSGNGTKYLALYELENDQVMNTEAWSKAVNTEWTLKMRPHLKPLANPAKRIF
ncbi:MAG: DUF4286 family protein [Candidatus Tectomicrobia bacterium]